MSNTNYHRIVGEVTSVRGVTYKSCPDCARLKALLADVDDKNLCAEENDGETWNQLGETLREMGEGNDLGPLGQIET